MKHIRQFGIILVISFIGELLKYVVPLKVPASIYGLVIMFVALELRIIRLDSVREASKFLIEAMPLMFVPAGVGLLTSWGVLKPICIPVIIIIIVSTVIVMVVSGHVTQAVIHFDRARANKSAQGNEHIYYRDTDMGEDYISEEDVK